MDRQFFFFFFKTKLDNFRLIFVFDSEEKKIRFYWW